MPIRVVLERGPKAKKFVAFAVDWPGWSRGAKTTDGAFETLAAYRDRYRPIAVRAGLEREFDNAGPLEIVEDRHTIRNESEEFAKKVGLAVPERAALEPGALAPYRSAYLQAMRAFQRGEVNRPMRSWSLAFLVRHSAFHTMDHAWEMEDKDLSGEAAS
jgi:hypothetical protein